MLTMHTTMHAHYREWYEPQAMMLSEEMTVVCGLLMGLNALDYNVMMSGDDYDKSVSVSCVCTCKASMH